MCVCVCVCLLAVFIDTVILLTFRLICPSAFFMYFILNLETNTEPQKIGS